MSDICVIGASSFTGKRFCEMMEERGHNVGTVDWRSGHALTRIGRMHVKYIVNFAALNVVMPSWDHAEDYFRVNVQKIAELAKLLRDRPFTKYVHISTPEVYGSSEEAIKEGDSYNPSTPYALSRSTAECILAMEYRRYGLPVVATRCANVYGPGQQFYRLIPKVLRAARLNVPFPLEGGGKSRRAWVYVDDACEAIERVMVHGSAGQAYNISGDAEYAIRTVVECCFDTVGVPINIEDVPGRAGQDARYLLDDSKIRDELGWGPDVYLDEGIRRTWEWLNENWDTLKDAPRDYEFKP